MKLFWTAVIIILAIGFIYALTAGTSEQPSTAVPEPNTTEQPQPEIETVEAALGETAHAHDVSVLPHIILEDSRCPTDVICIQAGTVRIHAELTSGLGTGWQTFELGVPVTTEAEEVTMISVSPAPHSERTIEDDEYLFRFEIKKR